MKKAILILLTLLVIVKIQAQDIAGQWNGILNIQGTQLRLVFNITKTDGGFSATMDSPDQGAKGIPVTSTSFDNGVLKLAVSNARIEYEGKLDENNIFKGNFKQGGMNLPLNLSREKVEKKKLVRPQEPTKPYPYYTEDVIFENKKAQISLAGTLTLPKKEGNFPVVVLITGSGPQNRDEELFGHKPFLVLADYLTKQGIGVLRYDDRGVAESKGNFKTATTQDFAADVEAAVAYLKTRKEVNKKQIGLIGHSEGGVIAPLVASKSKDVGFIVLLAGSGMSGGDLLLLQKKAIEKAMGVSDKVIESGQKMNKGAFDIITKTLDSAALKTELTAYFQQVIKDNPSVKPPQMNSEAFVNTMLKAFSGAWLEYFIRYNPFPVLKGVKCPVLALNGDKDVQVPSKENLEAIKRGLEIGKNKHITTKELPNLNHLFQECKTGLDSEYGTIEQTFSPTALMEIGSWILKTVGKNR
jgi:uncharacterized protein